VGKRLVIPDTDLEVSPLCYGLATFGTVIGQPEADRLYEAFRAAGGNFFDTAHCYAFWVDGGLGASERTLGNCLRRCHDRKEVVISTKGGYFSAGARYPRPDRYIAPATIASDIDESLERMGIDRIDLYYLHRDDPRLPAGEIVEMLNAEIARGRIRHLGASNWSTERIAQANEYAAARGLRGFVVSQPQWNLAHPNPALWQADATIKALSDRDVQWHAARRLAVMAYSSTACGYFATDGKSAKETFDNPVSRGRLERAKELARRLGCTPNQIALAYLMNHDFPVIPILGTTKLPHLQDGLGAQAVRLDARQVRWLRDGA